MCMIISWVKLLDIDMNSKNNEEVGYGYDLDLLTILC